MLVRAIKSILKSPVSFHLPHCLFHPLRTSGTSYLLECELSLKNDRYHQHGRRGLVMKRQLTPLCSSWARYTNENPPSPRTFMISTRRKSSGGRLSFTKRKVEGLRANKTLVFNSIRCQLTCPPINLDLRGLLADTRRERPYYILCLVTKCLQLPNKPW